MKIRSFTDLIVWQESHALSLLVYRLSEKFPDEEVFGITNQMRRASVSITSNIAEGFSRVTSKDKKQFYTIACGSLTELQSQFLLCRDLKYLDNDEFDISLKQSTKVHKLLNSFIKSTAKEMYVRN